MEVQTAGGSISRLVSGFPELLVRECDGTDVLESYEAAGEVVRWVRGKRGPALLHAHVVRPYSHSLSDDERVYKTAHDREIERRTDPILRTRRLLVEEGIATDEELDRLEKEVKENVDRAADEALTHPQQDPGAAMLHLYSEEVNPTGPEFDTEDSPEYAEDAEPTTMVDLLNACLRDEMERNPGIVLFGQDVADASRKETLDEVKGKGGVFKVTWGLPEAVRERPGLQLPPCRGEHRRARGRYGDPGPQARRGDPVL